MLNQNHADVETKVYDWVEKGCGKTMLTDNARKDEAVVVQNGFFEMSKEVTAMMNTEEKMLAKNKADMVNEASTVNRWEKELPAYICTLVNKVLDVKNADIVAEINCGKGDYLKHTANEYPDVKLVGVDKDADALDLAASRLNTIENVDMGRMVMGDFLNRNIPEYADQITLCKANPFYYFNGNRVEGIYDKAFSYMSERIRLRNERAFGEYMRDSKLYHAVRFHSTSDWYINEMLVKSIKENGRAVALMNSGAMNNKIDEESRRFFVENGYIEAVIKLPERLALRMRGMVLVVFSHGNKGVRFADASGCYVNGRRSNELSADNIEAIVAMLKSNGENSKEISVEQLLKADCVLTPERYLIPDIDSQDSISIGDAIKAVKRAVPLKAAALDKAVVSEETSIKYIRLADLQDGVINDQLCSLKELEEKWNKYLLDDGDVVISKIAKPCKLAVYRKRRGEAVVMVGNMYALSIDEEKLNPYYLQAYLQSELGDAALDACSTGSTLPIISVEALKSLQIPVPSIKVQRIIAERCVETLTKIKMHKRMLNKAIEELSKAYDLK